MNSFPFIFVIPWVCKDANQVNGVSVQKKGGHCCNVVQDECCFNGQKSFKMVMKFGPVRHSFSSKTKFII